MDTAILLGLGSALLYGFSDFAARFAGRAVGVLRTMFWVQLSAALGLSVVVAATGALAAAAGVSAGVWAITVAGNLVILLATALLYRGLSRGRLAVVAPITACYGAVTAVLSCLSGEALGAPVAGGLLLAVAGAALSSVPSAPAPANAGDEGRPAAPFPGSGGAGWACAAAVCYGIGFFAIGHWSVPALGHLLPVWLYYGCGAVVLGLVGTACGLSLSVPNRREIAAVAGTGGGAVGGALTLTAAVGGAAVAVPTVLSSLASVVTVVLARLLIRERVAPHQWAGVAMVIAGLAVLNLRVL
ncbi:EamA family transporter [Rhizosaccharibacter radicis]|uniref:EamA family transporter n=1 Tax=Rhizosaccharibacter radicis TaxID=2782605 RepID=A0ABT1VXQ7_9PROT|nr:EamA family transporter [Acetobacteraceae bacterium KSS12]